MPVQRPQALDMETFKQRLTYILAGRRIHPWAASLGISKGAAENMGKGNIPGPEILKLIRQQESINVGWLVTGDGAPFLVEQPEDLSTVLESELADLEPSEPLWAHFFTDGQQLVMILRKPSLYIYREKSVLYDFHRLIAVAVNSITIQAINQFSADTSQNDNLSCYMHRVDPETMDALLAGKLGPFQLLGNSKSQPAPAKGTLIDSPSLLLEEIQRNRQGSEKPAEISMELMRSVIQCVESTASEEGMTLNSDQRARVFTAVYRYAVRTGLSSQEIDTNNVLSILEVI